MKLARRAARSTLVLMLVIIVLSTLVGAPATVAAGPEQPEVAGARSAGDGSIVSVIVRLEGPTIWDLAEADRTRSAAMGKEPMSSRTLSSLNVGLELRQEPMVAAVEAAGGTVIDRYQNIMNGLLVRVSAGRIPVIARIPGVLSVAPAPLVEPAISDSVPHIRAPEVWSEKNLRGRGVLVAALDTGVDYTHATFGGSGDPAEYNVNDEDVVESGTFPTAGVVGGYDFAGKRYSPSIVCGPYPGQECHIEPRPDDDPLDSRGHGTHVAGIISGDGSSDVGPGVAPGAHLVALKIFGNPIGSPVITDLTASAFEWVADNNLELPVPGFATERIDVVNLSVTGAWITGSAETERIVTDATERGLTVVVAAGNEGSLAYRLGPVSGAEHAVSVGSTYSGGDRGLLYEASWTDQEGPQKIDTVAWDSLIVGQPSTIEVGGFDGPLAWFGRGCPDDAPVQDPAGKVALVERGGCPFVDKIRRAQQASATAVVLFTDHRDAGPFAGQGELTIPAVMIEREIGLKSRELAEAGTPVSVRVYEPAFDLLADVLSPFSSRGPARLTGGLKPQLVAPGSFIMSAWPGTGTGGRVQSGTSMSSAHVAGVAALLAERNRKENLGLDAIDIGALAINHAVPTVKIERQDIGRLASMAHQGAGRIDALAASQGETLVRSEDGVAELGFGHIHATTETVEDSRTLRVRSLSSDPKRYAVQVLFAYPEEDFGKGLEVSTSRTTVELGPRAQEEIEVRVQADPSALRPWALAGHEAVIEPELLSTLEVDGIVRLSEADEQGQALEGGEMVAVPFLALPRRHSCVTSDGSPFELAGYGDSYVQSFANPCYEDGWATVYPVVATDPADDELPGAIDIEKVGMRYGLANPDDPESDTVLEWLLQTRGPRRTPQGVEFRVYIDVNQDGVFDRVVFNKYGPDLELWVDFGLENGRWVIANAPVSQETLEPLYGETRGAVFYQSYELDETTTRLWVLAEDLGLDLGIGDQRFDFAVTATDVAHDFQVAGEGLAIDRLPEGLADGERLTYDQWQHDCFTPTLQVSVPAGGEQEFELGAKCQAPSEDEPVSVELMFAYPDNMPGEEQSQLRSGTIGSEGRVEHWIYLPIGEKNG